MKFGFRKDTERKVESTIHPSGFKNATMTELIKGIHSCIIIRFGLISCRSDFLYSKMNWYRSPRPLFKNVAKNSQKRPNVLPRGPPWPLKFPPPRWLPPLFGLKAKLIISLKGNRKIPSINHSQYLNIGNDLKTRCIPTLVHTH